MMDQRNMIIAGAIAAAAVLAYYVFANTTPAPAPKKDGTGQNHTIPAPTKYATITKLIA
jgi:Flp pilus assembly protein CpaB